MNIVAGMLYTPEQADYAEITAQLLARYAEHHGYHCIVKSVEDNSHWKKMAAYSRAMADIPEADWFMWLDSDAVIVTPRLPVERTIHGHEDMIVDDGFALFRNCPNVVKHLRDSNGRVDSRSLQPGEFVKRFTGTREEKAVAAWQAMAEFNRKMTRPAKMQWPAELPFNEAAPKILITGGIGDVFALEAMMPVEIRETLDTIFYACPAAGQISEMMKALLNYPRLRNHIILESGRTVYHKKKWVEHDFGEFPCAVEDWSILEQFKRSRPYIGSSFLREKALPDNHVVIMAASLDFGHWSDRNFDDDDWGRTLAFLDRSGMRGIVVGRDRTKIPAHRRLLDMRYKTTILESVELLKAAQGYIGIDSCLSVLAAKLFPINRLAIKSTWGHCYVWQHVYFAPYTTFPFLQRKVAAI